jgi:hypothetical protein
VVGLFIKEGEIFTEKVNNFSGVIKAKLTKSVALHRRRLQDKRKFPHTFKKFKLLVHFENDSLESSRLVQEPSLVFNDK